MDLDELDPNDELPPEDDDAELSAAPEDDDDALPADADAGGGAVDGAAESGARRPSRGEARFQRLSTENRDLRARLERLERGNREPSGPSAAERERAEREERERVQFMSPDEKAEYFYLKGQREFGQQFSQLRNQVGDQADRAAFEALCGRNPVAARQRDEVERLVADQRAAGNYGVTREAVLRIVLGDRVLKGRAAPAARNQRRAGAEAVDRERVRPPGGAKTGAPSDRNARQTEREARRQRLANITF